MSVVTWCACRAVCILLQLALHVKYLSFGLLAFWLLRVMARGMFLILGVLLRETSTLSTLKRWLMQCIKKAHSIISDT